MHINGIKPTRADRIFDIVNYTLLGIITLLVLYPLYIIVIASFSDPYAVMRGEVLLFPKDISFIGYERLLQYADIWRAYFNTAVYTFFGTCLNVTLTMFTGYALSRRFKGKKFVTVYFVFTMFFNGGLVPTFLQVKNYGLLDNPLIFIVMGAVVVWNIMIARTFMGTTLPQELFEAATLDGCDHFHYFFKVVLPLSKPLLAVLAVYYAVGHWNDFMTGMIYIDTQEFQPLQVVLKGLMATLQISDDMSMMLSDMVDAEAIARLAESVKYCAIVISTVPVMIFYVFLQKFFVKGVMIGSMKG